MAQVSVQYALKNELQEHTQKELKQVCNAISGVQSVSVNLTTHILCIDYDDIEVIEDHVEKVLKKKGFAIELIDKITF